MSGFTGLKLEPHQILPGAEVCVWYVNGERKAVLYIDHGKLRMVHEADVAVEVLKRSGPFHFEDVTP